LPAGLTGTGMAIGMPTGTGLTTRMTLVEWLSIWLDF
tara:strand:- start:937 stop:1047 length:111 start_codon:yes stop_codon:yes gene_type:complete